MYSQCYTAQFGSALHFALSQCSSFETDSLPHLIRQQRLRKRTGYDSISSATSVHGSASTTTGHFSLYRHASISASVFPRPTRGSDNKAHSYGPRTAEPSASRFINVLTSHLPVNDTAIPTL